MGKAKADELIHPMRFILNKRNLEEFCNNSHSINEVIRMSGRKCTGGNHQLIRSKITEFGIDTSHFTGQAWAKGKSYGDVGITRNCKYTSDDQILGYHPEIARKDVKRYVLNNGIIPYQCEICGNIGEWLGQKMTLELDHRNGEPYDHSKDNLRFLCPNCHAIQPTSYR